VIPSRLQKVDQEEVSYKTPIFNAEKEEHTQSSLRFRSFHRLVHVLVPSFRGSTSFVLLSLEPVRVGKLVFEVFAFEHSEFVQDELKSIDVQSSGIVNVSACFNRPPNLASIETTLEKGRLTSFRQYPLVNLEQPIQRSFVDM
jgi:hypothetical protein